MPERISPAAAVQGSIRLPGDKSISHRYAMLAAISEGESVIRNYSSGADCQSTLGCLRSLQVPVDKTAHTVRIQGAGLRGLKTPEGTLDAGNSGSTIRMLSGILAAQPWVTRIGGDESLSRRPMARIMAPLQLMGAEIRARDGRFPPLEVHGRSPLKAIDYQLPVASAQVKSCVLFAGLYGNGVTTVRESLSTRDHTEIALREFGADIGVADNAVSIRGGSRLRARDLTVPGDLSSAAFFIVAALLRPGTGLTIRGVGLNPRRAALLTFLRSAGVSIEVLDAESSGGELAGDLDVRGSGFRGGVIEGELTAALIDEIPVLAVLGAASDQGLTVRNAEELRVKETDRIATVAENLRRMGVAVETSEDGLYVAGRQRFRAVEVDSFGDHRIAMAFAVAALAADDTVTIHNAEAASVSFPEFWDTLASITR